MVLLKKINKEEGSTRDAVFFGMKMLKEEASFLCLYCLAKGISKSSVVQNLISSWIDEKRKEFTDEELIKIIAERGIRSYLNLPGRQRNFNFFRNKLRLEFKHKTIDESTVDAIIKAITNEKDKEK